MLSAFLITTVVVVILTVINAVYVAAEFALVGARKTRISELAAAGSGGAKLILGILEDHHRLDRAIAAAQIGITLTSLIAGYVGQGLLSPVLVPWLARIGIVGEAAAAGIAAVVILLGITGFQVVFGELLPKSVALRFPEQVAMACARPLQWSLILLSPFITFFNGSAFALMRLFRLPYGGASVHVHSPQELEGLFKQSARGGVIDAGEREMLHNVFLLDERVVRQIMIPRVRVSAIDVDTPVGEALKRLSSEPHTRFPVFEGTIDNVVGTLHIRDLFVSNLTKPEGSLREIMRPAKLSPESMTVYELWQEFKQERSTMAVIFDEYGGMAGIVTLEDILEEIFGELQDEFDLEPDLYREDREGRIHVRGDMLVSEANARLLLTFPEDGPETVGGFVMDLLERSPRVGDEVMSQQVVLRVEAVEEYAITEVSITPPAETVTDPDEMAAGTEGSEPAGAET